jgi:hypothetical protein
MLRQPGANRHRSQKTTPTTQVGSAVPQRRKRPGEARTPKVTLATHAH